MIWIFFISMIIAGASSYLNLYSKKKWIRIVAEIIVFITFPIALFSIASLA